MIVPRGNRLLIEPIKQDSMGKVGEFFVQDGDFKAPQSIFARVLAIGPTVEDIKVGDQVFCSQFAPTQVKEKPNDNTVVLPEEDVLAVLVPEIVPTKK